MIQRSRDPWLPLRWKACCLCWLIWVGLESANGWAAPPAADPEPLPPVLTRDAAVRWALQYNPAIAAVRQQHGIAAAAVVIADTYPFNPIWSNKLFATNGPESAGVTNHVAMEQRVDLVLEVRGQGTYRRQGACAALSRADWEIAFKEETLAIDVIKAFDAVLYRQEKLKLVEETIRLNERAAKDARKQLESGKVTSADVILAGTDVDDANAQRGAALTALAVARSVLRHELGLVDEAVALEGSLETPAQEWDATALSQAALGQRADLRALQAALAEAKARVGLAIADRYGNPNFGPDFEYNETRAYFIGAQLVLPLPVLNSHRGEIQQRQAERDLAGLQLRQTEVVIREEVHAALDRLRQARAHAATYHTKVLPNLQDALQQLEKLLPQGKVDLLKVIDVRRKLLKARDGYLDALWEVTQAQAALAAAVGDPALASEP